MISIQHLSKNYSSNSAVIDLNLNIEDGVIYGFLGPNGAGKSTTLNILAGCLSASAGRVAINGYDTLDKPLEAKSCIGFLPEQPPLYPELTPWEQLEFAARSRGIIKSQIEQEIISAMEKAGAKSMAFRLNKNLSKGYKQRVGLAQAIIGSPPIIILDEPLSGLDPLQAVEMRKFIRNLTPQHTVILSSHILSDISAICDQVLIMSEGRLVANDTPKNLSGFLKEKDRYILKLLGNEGVIRKALGGLVEEDEISFSTLDRGTSVSIEVAHDDKIQASIAHALAAAGIPVLESQIESVSLEQVFLKLAGRP